MSDKKQKLREISELGEFGLIDHITKDVRINHKNTIKGIGDDATVLNYGKKHVVLSTDLLVQSSSFSLLVRQRKTS